MKWFTNNSNPRRRLLIAIGIAASIYAILPQSFRLSSRIIVAWDSGASILLGLTWGKMLFATHQQMRRQAQLEDSSRWAILIFVVTGAIASLSAIVFMLKDRTGVSASLLTEHVFLSVLTIICSWLLMHTMFALHYAHSYYYSNSKSPSESWAGGLDFPGEKQPDYWDFLYFSFVIGMTSQVSDVEISSRSLRRQALVHGVVSFIFNTVILALSINLIAGLI